MSQKDTVLAVKRCCSLVDTCEIVAFFVPTYFLESYRDFFVCACVGRSIIIIICDIDKQIISNQHDINVFVIFSEHQAALLQLKRECKEEIEKLQVSLDDVPLGYSSQ